MLARTKGPNGPTLFLSEDRVGLAVRAELDGGDPRVLSLRSEAQRCGLEMSFSFRADSDTWNEDRTRRELHAVDLNRADVSTVAAGANPRTDVSVRAAMSEAERRALADSLRGTSERRVCPELAVDLRGEAPRGRSQITVTRRYLDIARARRARREAARTHPGSDAAVPGHADFARRYSDDELAAGAEGRASSVGTGAGCPTKDQRDLLNALAASGSGEQANEKRVR